MSRDHAPRVAFVNLGCRVNRTEIDGFAIGLSEAGCEVVSDRTEADLVVVNTCAVTGEAQTKTRKAVRQASKLPSSPLVVATGCAATLFSAELEPLSPNVFVEPNKDHVVDRVVGLLGIDEHEGCDICGQLAPTPTGRTRPGVKIQDGCDNRCTYCIVWKARGPSRSVSARQVVREVREACARGAHEVVLVGINLGNYRAPADDALREGTRLPGLLRHVMAETDVDRLRLSSIEPPDVSDDLLGVMADSGGRVAPFLHVCLQSGCDATLRRMGRPYVSDDFRARVSSARRLMPDVAVGTDVIVGFPGETDEEFEESLAFCEEMAFARMHVFRYSVRPGTPAAEDPRQVEAHVSAERGRRMRALAHRMRDRAASQLVGTRDLVLVQAPGKAVTSHLFDVTVDASLPVGSLAEVKLALGPGGTLLGLPSAKAAT